MFPNIAIYRQMSYWTRRDYGVAKFNWTRAQRARSRIGCGLVDDALHATQWPGLRRRRAGRHAHSRHLVGTCDRVSVPPIPLAQDDHVGSRHFSIPGMVSILLFLQPLPEPTLSAVRDIRRIRRSNSRSNARAFYGGDSGWARRIIRLFIPFLSKAYCWHGTIELIASR